MSILELIAFLLNHPFLANNEKQSHKKAKNEVNEVKLVSYSQASHKSKR